MIKAGVLSILFVALLLAVAGSGAAAQESPADRLSRKAAKQIGLTIPPYVLARANKVIK